ncbi:MAG: peptidylprolyl isomerase [Clostridiales bacterium]|nr:peptidylprolyl isomerase [Clostridiales bacterium]
MQELKKRGKKPIGMALLAAVFTAALVISLSACGGAGTPGGGSAVDNGSSAAPGGGSAVDNGSSAAAGGGSAPSTGGTTDKEVHPVIEITMEDGGVIDVELDRSAAPITVDNFLKLVNEGFYDGLTFHRVIDGFMIQGGDPLGNGTGGSDQTIKGEFSANGVNNPISHVRGVISMARSQDYNSASSQFFITNADSTFLDGQYAAFGHVTKGMDEVDKIAKVPKDSNDKPITPVVIKTIKQIS